MPIVGEPVTNGGVYLGIDPGLSGGLAFLSPTAGITSATKMPDTEADLWDWFRAFARGHPSGRTFAVIEKVGGYVGGAEGKGRSGGAANGSAMFKFGASYGGLRMALTAAGVPFDEVSPQRWQRTLGIFPRKKGEPKAELKRRCRQKAQQLFPGLAVTNATADAILLAEFCRRLREGKLSV